MPIYQGLSTKNKAEIIINSQQMGRVYVGDRLVWQKPSGIFYPEYGLLYNWYAVNDIRNIVSDDNWRVPHRNSDWGALFTYLGGDNIVAPIKEFGIAHWLSNNGTNLYKLSLVGGGERYYLYGNFRDIKTLGWYASSIQNERFRIVDNVEGYVYYAWPDKTGNSIRLVSDASGVADGTITTYTGNDLKQYYGVAINGLYWLQYNLSETRFRDGSIIPWHGANPANFFTNAEWVALTTAGCCAYDNVLSNVANGFTFPT